MPKFVTLLSGLSILLTFSTSHAVKSCDEALSGFGPSTSAFSSRLGADLLSRAPEENMAIPVTAIHSVLSMAMLGTGEKSSSRAELAEALNFGENVPSEDILGAYAEAIRALRADGDGVTSPTVRLINALFVNPNFKLTPHYSDAMTKEFDASVASATPSEVSKINDMVKSVTNGKLSKVIDSLNPNMRMVLLSASYIKGSWEKAFKKSATTPAKFHPTGSPSGSSYDVQMMYSLYEHGVAEDDNFQIVEIAMKGPKVGRSNQPRYSALLIVPKGSVTVADALKMSPDELAKLLSQKSNSGKTALSVPKFDFKWSGDLIPTLEKMGVHAPFGDADFSNMSDQAKNLYISQVKSSGFLEFNESGLEGGGAAAVEMTTRGLGPRADREVIVNRPFALLVRDNELGVNLLQAAVMRPNATGSNDAPDISAAESTSPSPRPTRRVWR